MEGNLLPWNHPKFKNGDLKHHLLEIRRQSDASTTAYGRHWKTTSAGRSKSPPDAGKMRAESDC